MKIQVEQLKQIIREEIRDVKNSLLTEVFQSDMVLSGIKLKTIKLKD